MLSSLSLHPMQPPFPWPLGDGADSTAWESIFPITRTYGNFDHNLFWTDVDSISDDMPNFHTAIDISFEDAATESIRVVEAGMFTYCMPFDSTIMIQWGVQIFRSGSAYGWQYGHVQGDDGYPFKLEDYDPTIGHTAQYGDHLGTMA